MSASSDSSTTRSPSTESSIVTNADGLLASNLTRAQIANFVDTIRENKKVWSFGDKLGVAYHFTGDRLYKQNNVVNRTGVRTRLEIRNLGPFFTKLHTTMLQYPFVKVQLCGSAEAYLMYCHSKLVRLEPKRSVLLMGDVCFVQGHFNNYFAEPIPIAPGTLVKLHSRAFDIRVSSNYHCIFVRTEDIIKNRVRLEQLDLSGQQVPAEEDGESQEESIDEMDEDYENFELDSANEESNSTEGSRRSGRRPTTLGRRRGGSGMSLGTPQVMPPRAARLLHAATQITPPRTVQRRRTPEDDDEARDDQQRRPRSV